MRGLKGSVPPHGDHGRYTNHGCRCLACTLANRLYHRQYRRHWRLVNSAAAEPRFVVRSVTGYSIPGGAAKDSRERTLWNVLDRLDCYTIAYQAPQTSPHARFLCEQEADRLNLLHEEAVAA